MEDIALKGKTQPSYLDLFKSKYKVLATTTIWTSLGLCFFGINQYVTFRGNNLLTNVILLGLIQIPCIPISIRINKSLGRKRSTILCLLTTGTTMLLLILLPRGHWLSVTSALIGFGACSTTFNIIYIFTGELFPTSTRNMAYGLCTAIAKVGAMLVPFIVILKPQWLPSSIFAAIAFTSVVFCFFLPETKGRQLADIA